MKQRFFKALQTYLERCQKHSIFIWLLLFFPVGIYKAIRYKALPKWLITIILCVIVLFGVVIVDSYITPRRLADHQMKKQVEQSNIGTIRDYAYNGSWQNSLLSYLVITNKGTYDCYFENHNNQLYLGSIYNLNTNQWEREPIGKLAKYKDCAPSIVRYFSKKKGDIGVFHSCEDMKENSQVITTDKGKYTLSWNQYQVTRIDKDGSLEKEYDIDLPMLNGFEYAIQKYKKIRGKVTVFALSIDEDNITIECQDKEQNFFRIKKGDDGNYQIGSQILPKSLKDGD